MNADDGDGVGEEVAAGSVAMAIGIVGDRIAVGVCVDVVCIPTEAAKSLNGCVVVAASAAVTAAAAVAAAMVFNGFVGVAATAAVAVSMGALAVSILTLLFYY